MNNSRLLILGLLLVLGLGFVGWRHLHQTVNQPNRARWEKQPDTIVKTLTVKRFNELGHLQNQLKAQQSTHYLHDDTTTFKKPQLWIYQKQPWLIVADEATAIEGSEDIRLYHHVYISQKAGDGTPSSSVKTEFLQYLSRHEMITTDKLVHFRQGALSGSAIGMLGYLGTGEVKLLQRVSGNYEKTLS